MRNRYLVKSCLLMMAAGLVACGTTGEKKPVGKAKAAEPAFVKPEGLAWLSGRVTIWPKPEACPASDVSWRKGSVKSLMDIANACALLGKWERLEAIGDHLAQQKPNEPWGAYYLSIAAEGRRDFARALWMVELSLKKANRLGVLWYQKARVAWAMGDYALAVQGFEKALQLEPEITDAHLQLAQIYFREHVWKKSAQHFSAVLERETENVVALAGMAEIKIQEKDVVSAADFFERAINASPTSLTYRLRLAALYEVDLRDPVRALQVYKRLDAVIAERRAGMNTKIPFDLKAKIRDLEASIEKAAPGRKITGSASGKRVKE